ncbi:hypothetical protein [Mycoplasma mycoides]|uniref:hypothetical protein n=1 Tax=Mycoplasma mycoides TaxID=2102 RepID=UPI0022403FBE|nr:hypothetical protein [Mycoplasma mycoides]
MKIFDFVFPRAEKLNELKEKPEYSYLWGITTKITSFYHEIISYSDLRDFETKNRSVNEKLYKDFDQIVDLYEKEEQKIWGLLNLIK